MVFAAEYAAIGRVSACVLASTRCRYACSVNASSIPHNLVVLAEPSENRLVDPPAIELVAQIQSVAPRIRLPRKSDFAARDEANRLLGRNGEQWVLGFEQQRLQDAGRAELFQRVEWISDIRGDGAGYDILSYDATDQPRYIEVKTTNGAHTSAFIISRNELEFSQESGDAFHLYRVFQFRAAPMLYMLRGDVSKQLLHLEPIDYRASFRRIAA